MAYNIKSIRKQFKDRGIFYTDNALAQKMRSYLPDDVREVYDPTCGDGQLLAAFGDEVEKCGQEINEDQLKVAEKRLTNFQGYRGDTLTNPAFTFMKFPAIVANYPFSLKWEPPPPGSDPRFDVLPCIPTRGKADFAFLAHILYMLSDDGRAVVLNAPGVLFRGQREGKIRRWMIEQNYIAMVEDIEPGHFEDTNIATCILVLEKNRMTTDVLFKSQYGERTVSIEEIKENDYNLSVGRYIQPPREPEKEADLVAVGDDLRRLNLESFKASLDIELMLVQELGVGPKDNLITYLDNMEAIINETRRKLEE